MSRRIETNDLIGIQQEETWDHRPADFVGQRFAATDNIGVWLVVELEVCSPGRQLFTRWGLELQVVENDLHEVDFVRVQFMFRVLPKVLFNRLKIGLALETAKSSNFITAGKRLAALAGHGDQFNDGRPVRERVKRKWFSVVIEQFDVGEFLVQGWWPKLCRGFFCGGNRALQNDRGFGNSGRIVSRRVWILDDAERV